MAKRLVFIGLDGCDWNLLNRFLSQGKLPNLKRLIDSGVLAKCKTTKPAESPLVWNSILTGKTPAEHRVVFWHKLKLPLLPPLKAELIYPVDARAGKMMQKLLKHKIAKRVPFSSQDRKVKAVWNILTDYNKISFNVGWIFSWPAEAVKGVQTSWYLYPFEEAALDNFKRISSSRLAQRVYPEDLTEELSRLIVRVKDLDKLELSQMYFPTDDFDFKKPFSHKLNLWDYAKDKSFLKISHYLLEKQREWDFFSLYLYGIDSVCHSYWPFFEGATHNQKYKAEILSIGKSENFKKQAQNFGKIIERYYAHVDQELGKLFKEVSTDCNIVIVSDHGFDFNGRVHSDAPDAVFIASGPCIKKTEDLESVSIYDILPTLLVLLGLPQAEDMLGKAVKAILSDEFLRKFPLRSINSYEGLESQLKAEQPKLDEATRRGIEERLKSLGYID